MNSKPNNMDLRIFENGEGFLNDFFQSLQGQTGVNGASYFDLFREPPNFQSLLNNYIQPTYPNVLLLDGQSRAGKTWTALGLIKKLLEQKMADAVWSSGEDSSFIYSDGRSTVAEGIRWVINSIESLWREGPPESSLRLIVFLDDFFGSARLRPLGSDQSDLQFVRDFLTTNDSRNPLFGALLCIKNVHPSLLMTGRSSILSLAEVRLGASLGDRVARNERAFYQHLSGKLIGDRTSEWLDQCLNEHAAFTAKHSEFALPPMTAFSANFPAAEHDEVDIPDVLFGADLRAIMEELSRDEAFTTAFHGFSSTNSTARLRRLLLTHVAPALALPIPSLDACIVDDDSRSAVRAVLSLQPEGHGDFALRVPNRYYLRSIQQELLKPDRLELLADSLIAHAHANGLDPHCVTQLWILSRGVIERGLESVVEILKQEDKESAEEVRTKLAEKVRKLPGAKDQPLLQWETSLVSGSLESDDITRVAEKVPFERGLASAIGWGLYRFRAVMPLTDSKESVAINKICNAFERSANNLGDGDYRALTVAYSNFIRWVAQMEAAPAEGSPIHQMAGVLESVDSNSPALAGMRMVLEDALIWANSYEVEKDVQCVSVSNLPSARAFWDALESDTKETEPVLPQNESSIVNRLFSLEWHNEWKERGGYRREVLDQWLQYNQKRGLQLIHDNPELLDDNLAYHWSHMITQWSVWARDWCFSQDPNAHEYQKELIGCSEQKKNQGIQAILKQAIDSAFEKPDSKNRLRNAFFLLAIRSGGPSYGELLDVHTHLGDAIQKASLAPDNIKRNLAQAIYELIRQGYVDRTKAGVPLQKTDDLKDQLPRDLAIQCDEFLHQHGSGEEWKAYLKELDSITCLDVLPHDEADLIPYGRIV